MLNDVRFDMTPRSGRLCDYGTEAFRLVQVETQAQADLWTVLISTWHYAGGAQKIIGPRIKYLIYLGRQPIGAMSYTWGALRLKARDEFIGWDDALRQELLPHCLTQHRFLLCPWIGIKCLASHIINRSLKVLRADWTAKYGCEPFICTTYVDTTRYAGTAYRAAGWTDTGTTGGFGWNEHGRRMTYHGDKKHVFLTVMNRRFLRMVRSRMSPAGASRQEGTGDGNDNRG